MAPLYCQMPLTASTHDWPTCVHCNRDNYIISQSLPRRSTDQYIIHHCVILKDHYMKSNTYARKEAHYGRWHVMTCGGSLINNHFRWPNTQPVYFSTPCNIYFLPTNMALVSIRLELWSIHHSMSSSHVGRNVDIPIITLTKAKPHFWGISNHAKV